MTFAPSRRVRTLGSLVAAATLLLAPAGAWADEPSNAAESDALDPLRERFRAGMDKYKAGAFAEAIEIWEAIYGELGAARGYRLAFNIARAYEQLAATRSGSAAALSDAARAAHHYAAYVDETTRRQEAGERLEPLIEKQEREAKDRLAAIEIRGDAGIVFRLDDGAERRAGAIVWAVPGPHLVTFHPGTSEEQSTPIQAYVGQLREVLAPPPRAPRATVASPPAPRFELRQEHPFSATVLYVGAGATLLSVVVPAVLYANAHALEDRWYDPSVPRSDKDGLEKEYERARSNAYASIAVPGVLGAATLGLAAYWLFGARRTRVPVSASVVPGGGALSAGARF